METAYENATLVHGQGQSGRDGKVSTDFKLEPMAGYGKVSTDFKLEPMAGYGKVSTDFKLEVGNARISDEPHTWSNSLAQCQPGGGWTGVYRGLRNRGLRCCTPGSSPLPP